MPSQLLFQYFNFLNIIFKELNKQIKSLRDKFNLYIQ